jgi:asparagine synthase (glutamine-hydrolysing)
MTGVCGWLGATAADAPPVLNRMLRALGAPEDIQGLTSEGAALGAHSPFGLASLHAADGVLAAIDGRPRFDDPDLARAAREISPAAALATAWRRFGSDLLAHVHGSFALAVIEPAKGTALLAIDRMGIHRLCFAPTAGGLVFGGTCDSVVSHPAFAPKISHQGIFDYLYAHMVPAPGTIYEGVEKLLPAQFLLVRDGKITRDFYWEAAWQDDEHADFDARAREFRALLSECVGDARDEHRLGAFLSGGTDSSTVSGMLTRVSGKPAETFSIGFEAEGFDEIEYARIAVRHFGMSPHEYYVTPDDVVRAIPLIAAAYDEPFGNASAVPTYFCALKAKEAGMEVMLAGDGGDEILGGNVRYAKQKVFELYWRLPAAVRKGLVEPLALNLPGAGALLPLRKLQSYVQQARVPLPDRLETYNFLHREPLANIFDPAFLQSVDPEQPHAIQRDAYFRTRAESPVNRMLHLDWKQTLADNDLRKVCRMTELAGVEVRYPLLDERMVAFAAMLPPSYKVKGHKLRWFFKEALKDFLPHEILTKSKHGFGLPFGLWMQRHAPLHELAHESLRAFRGRGYLREDYLDRLIDAHQTGHATYYGVMIWVIMMLEQWLAHHADRART